MKTQLWTYEPGMEQTILDKEFHWVRSNMFPEWDRDKEWTIAPKSIGRSAPNEKTILIDDYLFFSIDYNQHPHKLLPKTTKLRQEIILDIIRILLPKGCYLTHRRGLFAITDCYLKAEEIHQKRLGRLLRGTFWKYAWHTDFWTGRLLSLKAAGVYSKIRELLLEQPGRSFEEIINDVNYIAQQAVEAKFKYCRQVYDSELGKILRHKKRYFFLNAA